LYFDLVVFISGVQFDLQGRC